MQTQRVLLSSFANGEVQTQITEQPIVSPQEGEVLIRAHYSSLNYKDALGVTGRGRIFKTMPIIGGIDVAGEIVDSRAEAFKKGDMVLVTGCGLGETHNGGYAEYVTEKAALVVPLPINITAQEAMIYGTAGFTAALCLERMEQNGQRPDKGPIMVTGASGGVGQFALSFFNKAGYKVEALSGKDSMAPRLKTLGAACVHNPSQFDFAQKPLETVKYGGLVDNVGGPTLSGLIPYINLWGNVACVGLAQSHELQSTLMPLILRGVSLLGISSNNTTWDLRLKIWRRLASDLKPEELSSFVSHTIGLEDVVTKSHSLLKRQEHGRILIRLI